MDAFAEVLYIIKNQKKSVRKFTEVSSKFVEGVFNLSHVVMARCYGNDTIRSEFT